MAYNKVVYAQKVLIDLTNDTVTKETLLPGVKAHDKSGNLITGSFLKDCPKTFVLEEPLLDSSGDTIFDSDENQVNGWCIYDKR